MTFVQQIATRVTVLHFGAIFAEGTIAEVLANEGVAAIYLGTCPCRMRPSSRSRACAAAMAASRCC